LPSGSLGSVAIRVAESMRMPGMVPTERGAVARCVAASQEMCVRGAGRFDSRILPSPTNAAVTPAGSVSECRGRRARLSVAHDLQTSTLRVVRGRFQRARATQFPRSRSSLRVGRRRHGFVYDDKGYISRTSMSSTAQHGARQAGGLLRRIRPSGSAPTSRRIAVLSHRLASRRS